MPARVSAPSRERDYDYSNVGKVGRRTGVTLAPRPLDEHGLEEITGLFSSPRKPSPVSDRRPIVESVEGQRGGTTPRPDPSSLAQTPYTAASKRKSTRGHSHPPPRSASPKKSGITGTARRSGLMDILANKQLEHELQEDFAEHENRMQDLATPPRRRSSNARAASARPATVVNRFSPDRTPLRNRVLHQRAAKSAVATRISDAQSLAPEEILQDEDQDDTPSRVQIDASSPDEDQDEVDESGVANIMADDDQLEGISMTEPTRQNLDLESPPPTDPELPNPPAIDPDYSDEDRTFEPPSRRSNPRSVPNKANSRRKRKSDALEEGESITVAISSPAAKRARRKANDTPSSTALQPAGKGKSLPRNKAQPQVKATSSQSKHGRKPLSKKDTNSKLTSPHQQELDDIVEKIRARPSAPKSLYVLRRETPADESVTHTRSGRISIKPLAYWRNERCVYSDTPGRSSTGIEDGARFPLNSIKEIVRTHEIDILSRTKNRKSRKRNGKGKGKASDINEETDSELDLDADGETLDPDADEWEINLGTLKGPVASWDAEHQTGVPDESITVDVAYAHAAIQTKDVKGSTFRYAKLLSSKFFGAGVVDLPGGGLKRAKNSRKMHMCFFVVQGRVTVRVGGMGGQDGDEEAWGTRFSVGKGGFWQVPRGNQYSIENEHGKTARIFFSQGCEAAPGDVDE